MPDQKARVGWMAIAAFFFVVQLAYLLMPFDLFPEAMVPVLGYLDDLVVSLISIAAAAAAGSYVIRKEQDQPDQIDGPKA